MMANRIADAIDRARNAFRNGRKLDGSGPIDPDAFDRIEPTLDVDFAEHAAYQDTQAWAHVSGILTTEEAQTIYVALGEVGSTKNGGWAAGTDLATKVVVTNVMRELLDAKIRAFRAGMPS